MAGICTAPLSGLTTIDGALAIQGARSGGWPGDPGSCRIGDKNGLRVDPVTGNLWTSPDVTITRGSSTVNGSDRSVEVTNFFGPTMDLTSLKLEMTAPGCGKSVFQGSLAGGYAGFRCANGNNWTLQRFFSMFVDDVPVGFTGLQPVNTVENATGANFSVGGPVESSRLYIELTPGQKVRVEAVYSLYLGTFTANAVNFLTWRAPVLQADLWTIPS